MFILGSVLLIVPGLILVAHYSMALFVAEHEHSQTIGAALNETSKKMVRNRTSMFSYKTLFWIFYLVVIVLGILAGVGIGNIWDERTLLAVCLAFLCVVAIIVLWTLITVYYHACNEVFFQEAEPTQTHIH